MKRQYIRVEAADGAAYTPAPPGGVCFRPGKDQ